MDVDGYRELLRPLFAGRKVVLTGAVVQAHTGQVAALRDFGSQRCLVIAGQGTGPVPGDEDAEVLVLDVAAPDMVEEIRRWERLHADPPPEVLDALQRYDPEGNALVLVPPFDSTSALAGRPTWGARPPSWTALEDKTIVDALCDRAGVVRPPSEVVPVEAGALRGRRPGSMPVPAPCGRVMPATGSTAARCASTGCAGTGMPTPPSPPSPPAAPRPGWRRSSRASPAPSTAS